MSKVVERFLEYVKYHTTSDESSSSYPSTQGQIIFAKETIWDYQHLIYFTGGHNFHGKYEFIPTYVMEKAVDVIVKINN
ncbi:hypothetical protein [Thermoanaerobacter mathranii]|uniref:hypothetical protein n=1 Tax=Thermoanaerobacter mathranii TaxID=583357 RepID=UPI003AABA931